MTCASAAACSGMSGRGRVGSTVRLASGSRRIWRAAITAAPFSASVLSVCGVQANSRVRLFSQPPPTRRRLASSSAWRGVRSKVPSHGVT